MSRLFTAVLLTFAFSYANATTLYSTTVSYDRAGHKIYNETMGFSETGFGGPVYVCFSGYAKDVCQIVRRAAGATQDRYVKGGHGMFEVKSCNSNGFDLVELQYTRTNDYDGSKDIKMDITPCGGDI